MYSADGYMSAQITRPDRSSFREERLEDGRPEELAEEARNYLAYAGPFHVRDSGTVVHEVALSLFPNWMGTAHRCAWRSWTGRGCSWPSPPRWPACHAVRPRRRAREPLARHAHGAAPGRRLRHPIPPSRRTPRWA
ncbi:lipocalin-like domain-containing protein [Streptomyces spiralis]|uniref:lipocalin-like domain-containing protein n=1 Tax=Streptomyces spiralis TaxID=66376 RepID=UPI0036CA0AD2